MNMDKPHEECGVFGIYNTTGCNVVHETFLEIALMSVPKSGFY